MEITCDNCQKKIDIPDSKIPKDRVAFLKCPGCQKRLPVRQNQQPEFQQKNKPDSLIYNELISDTYDAAEKPFDYMEKGINTSLICVAGMSVQDTIVPVLTGLKYHITIAENARDALKKMRYHAFELVVLDELFDCKHHLSNGVLIYLQHLPMATRRDILLVLLTDQFRTMDNLEAFHKSANMIINKADVNDFEKILIRGIAEHEAFYKVFKNTEKKIQEN